jgi:hypothetical protein
MVFHFECNVCFRGTCVFDGMSAKRRKAAVRGSRQVGYSAVAP